MTAGRQPTMNRRTKLILVIFALAAIAAGFLTAHPCDIDGRHDPACEVRP